MSAARQTAWAPSTRRFGQVRGVSRPAAATLREAAADDAHAIHALICTHVADGHLLPRQLDEIARHAPRFVVAVDGARIIGCADLAPLSDSVAEIRSLVISDDARGLGIGRRLMARLIDRALASQHAALCAFTSAPGFFLQSGFSIVPHTWLPAKIATDCRACSRFRSCGQYAVLLPLSSEGR